MESSDSHKLQLITGNLWSVYNTVAKVMHLPFKEGPDYSFVDASPSPWPNFVYNASVNQKTSELLIPEIDSYMQKRQLPPFWITDPSIRNGDFQKQMVQSGLKLVMKWPGMIFDVQDEIRNRASQSNSSSGNISGVNVSDTNIEVVTSELKMKQWFSIAEKNLFGDKCFSEPFHELFKNKNIVFFSAYYKNQFAGTTLVHVKDNTAGCYMVSVPEEFRGKGIATMLMREILKFAAQENIQFVTLQANAQSEKLYNNLGFKYAGSFDIYWKIGLF